MSCENDGETFATTKKQLKMNDFSGLLLGQCGMNSYDWIYSICVRPILVKESVTTCFQGSLLFELEFCEGITILMVLLSSTISDEIAGCHPDG